MSDMIKLELVTPTRVVAEMQVSEVIASGADGEFGVLPGHTLFISQLRPGEVRFQDPEGLHRYAVGRGFAEVGPNRIVILSDTVEEASTLDLAQIRVALERDESRLRAVSSSDPESAVLQDRIERNLARCAIAEGRR